MDICDRIICPIKQAVGQYCDERHDIQSAADMTEALFKDLSKVSPPLFVWWMMNVYLYTAHTTSRLMAVYNSILSEIGRQPVKAPLAAAISPYLISLTTQPTHEMWDETRDRPQHRELRALLFSISVWVL